MNPSSTLALLALLPPVFEAFERILRFSTSLTPDGASSLWRSILHSTDPLGDAGEAAMSAALDVALLAADVEAIRLAHTTAQALAIVDGAVSFTSTPEG